MSKQKTERPKKRMPREAFKILVENHADGYVAYPLGLKGVIVGGDAIRLPSEAAVW